MRQSHPSAPIHNVVVLDMRVGPDDGIGVLRRLKSMRLGMVVLMLSDQP
jgi:DNA-binding response OmpR family regulator